MDIYSFIILHILAASKKVHIL